MARVRRLRRAATLNAWSIHISPGRMPGAVRDEMIRKARQAETGSHMSEFLMLAKNISDAPLQGGQVLRVVDRTSATFTTSMPRPMAILQLHTPEPKLGGFTACRLGHAAEP
jgi:hypothetical protein